MRSTLLSSSSLSKDMSQMSAGMDERGGGRADSDVMAKILQGVTGVESGSSTGCKPVPRNPPPRAAFANNARSSSVFSSIVGDGQG